MWKIIGGLAGAIAGGPSAVYGLIAIVSPHGCRGLGEFMAILLVGGPVGGLVGCVLGVLIGRRFDPPAGAPGRWQLSLVQVFVLMALFAVVAAVVAGFVSDFAD